MFNMYSWFLSLPSFVSLSRDRDGALLIKGPGGLWSLHGITDEIEQALKRGVTKEGLAKMTSPEEFAQLLFRLSQLDSAGLLCRTIMGEEGPLSTWTPLVAGTAFDEQPSKGTISRFAFLRRKNGQSVLESPLRSSRVVLYDWRATAILGAYPEDPGLLSPSQTQALLCLFANVGFMDGKMDPPLWDFHSLLFHARSRVGRSQGPHGMAARAAATEIEEEQPAISLPTHRVAELAQRDRPFVEVVETRRSVREHDSVPLSLDQLGEFLWRVARDDGGRRPYPSAGQAYELEFSLAVHRCAGLEAGLYRYLPKSHGLREIPSMCLKELIEDAQKACCASTAPQILVLVSARFERMTSKYRAIAYANILKDVGVVFQTMALTAGAMNLAACPIGTGDSDLFCKAFGTDFATESSVGEFILGTPSGRSPTESQGYG
jgi:oxazoline/thiazoline dehydrogenase